VLNFRGANELTEVIVKAPQISSEEYKKYRGKNVAIYNNKIIAAGENSKEALQKALQKYPNVKPKDIEIYYIQIADELIL
jgi:dihydroxyacetone kinase-like predicted kinase